MSSLILFLLLSQTAPPQNYAGKIPNFPLQRHWLQSNTLEIPESRLYADRLGQGACFTMRSYVFTRQDGDAPVLAKTTTCTPASTLRMERSKHRRAQLILLDAPAAR